MDGGATVLIMKDELVEIIIMSVVKAFSRIGNGSRSARQDKARKAGRGAHFYYSPNPAFALSSADGGHSPLAAQALP